MLKKLTIQNVVIVGVSAGAIILGPNIEVVDFFTPEMNTVEIHNLTSIGITNNPLFPYYGRKDLFPDPSSGPLKKG
ncbi:Type 1 glutamine amidotransferase-like domain-containing protein [Neobacillus terrae]|uniref:Type 1 glutamine amidotransferase-like domain-containing protein n=1 Tax=Neobacillus terrae TaxID=3034837 RepID=UPI003083C0DD